MVDICGETLYNYIKNQALPKGTHMSAVLSTKHLHFQAGARSFFQEISCLPNMAIPKMEMSDGKWGFNLKSESTGMEIPMSLASTKIIEGEVVSWTFKRIDKDAVIRSVVIVND